MLLLFQPWIPPLF